MILDESERRRRFLLRVAGCRDKKVYIGPEIVHIAVTNHCNLSCRFCWFHSPGNPGLALPRKHLSLLKIKETVKDCVDLGVDTLYCCAEGETTCHPHFAHIMNFLASQPLMTVLFTNATFAAAKCRDVMKADEVRVNLGAADRDTYQDIHGQDRFDQVIANIRRLVLLRDTKKPSLKVKVVYVLNSMNIKQMNKVKRLVKGLGVDRFEPTRMAEYDLNRGIQVAAKKGEIPVQATTGCLNGWFYTTIMLDGKVRLCYQLFNSHIADITAMRFGEVWHSVSFRQARLEGITGRTGKLFDVCHECRRWNNNTKTVKDLLTRTGGKSESDRT